MARKKTAARADLKALKSVSKWGTFRGPLATLINDTVAELRRLRRVEKAARMVYDGLNARIDAAPSTAKPMFRGLAELHSALNR